MLVPGDSGRIRTVIPINASDLTSAADRYDNSNVPCIRFWRAWLPVVEDDIPDFWG